MVPKKGYSLVGHYMCLRRCWARNQLIWEPFYCFLFIFNIFLAAGSIKVYIWFSITLLVQFIPDIESIFNSVRWKAVVNIILSNSCPDTDRFEFWIINLVKVHFVRMFCIMMFKWVGTICSCLFYNWANGVCLCRKMYQVPRIDNDLPDSRQTGFVSHNMFTPVWLGDLYQICLHEPGDLPDNKWWVGRYPENSAIDPSR